MDSILFLTEAGEGIGFGHITRCKALQSFFCKNNVDSIILLNIKNEGFKYNENIRIINWLEEIEAIKAYYHKYRTVIVDSYLAVSKFYSLLKTIFKNVIVLDDYNRIVYPVDLIINPNLFGDVLNYSNQYAKVIGGSKYIILRNSFLGKKHKFTVRKNIQELLITIGGSDYRNILPYLIRLVKTIDCKVYIVGGTEDYKKKLKRLYSEDQFTFYGNLKSRSIISLMLKTDIVISGAGQTLNELAFLGVPTVSICIDKDQKLNIEEYYKRGFLLDMIFWDDKNISERLINNLKRMKDIKMRFRVSNIGKKLVSETGNKNIWNSINNCCL